MATWNSRGLRGSVLEELINYANQKYKDNIAKIENNVYNRIPHHKMR